MDPYTTNEVVFSSSHDFFDDCCSSRLIDLLIELSSPTRPAPRFLKNLAAAEFSDLGYIFDESELARLQRLYEFRQMLSQQQQGGEPDDFADAFSDAELHLPAEFQPSPDFLPQRRDEQRHRVEDHSGFNARLQDGTHLMDFDCAAKIAGIHVDRVGDHGRCSDTRAFQRAFRDADAIEKLPDSSRPDAAHVEQDGMRENDDALERAFDELVKRFAAEAAPALEAPLSTTVQCLLLPYGDAVQSPTPAAVASSVSDTCKCKGREREPVRIALPLLPALPVPSDLAAFAVWYATNARSAALRNSSGISRCTTDFHPVMKKAWGLVQRSQFTRFDRQIRPSAEEAPTDPLQLVSDAGLHLSGQHDIRCPAGERFVLPGLATSASEDHPMLLAPAISLSPVIPTALLETVAPAIYATDGADGPCQPIISMVDASASAALCVSAQLNLSDCSPADGEDMEARAHALLVTVSVLPSLAIASSAQNVGGLNCGHPLRAYDPGGGLPLQPYGHGKEALSHQLLYGSPPDSSAASPISRAADCSGLHVSCPLLGRKAKGTWKARVVERGDLAEIALHATAPVSYFNEIAVSSPAATVMAAHERESLPMPTSYVCCSTVGHALWVNNQTASSTDAPAPALAIDPPADTLAAAAVSPQPMLAGSFVANPKKANHMQTCDVNQVPVRSVTSSADTIDAQVLRNAISPTAIASKGTYPECMVTPNTAERLVPASNVQVAVTAVHPLHSGKFGLLVRLLAAHDGPNECATAQASCCTPQRMQQCATPDAASIPVSRMDTSAPAGPPVLEVTVHDEPSVRNINAAASAIVVADPADGAVAEVKSVDGNKLAFHLRAMDCGLAIHEYQLATAVHALATVSARDQTTATVKVVHERQPTPVNTSTVNYSNCHPYVQHFAPTRRDSAIMETTVPFLPLVRAELLEEAKVPALPVARGLQPLTTVARPMPGTDVTIDGGVKLTNVKVFATDPYPTVSPTTARYCYHAAPCNLLPGSVGGDSSRNPATSVRACFVTGLAFSNMPSDEGGGLLCTLASA